MSISYSGLTNYGKSTLPSVESWGTNMNILRDPPKSIMTRRKTTVNDTSEITQMIDDSGSRVCEQINVYARGVNPMVSVSYNNNGSNAGQTAVLNPGGQTQAYLPYRIMNYGAFRPPVLTPTDLLPLSRLPRVWTNAFTQPGFTDFSKKMKTCGTAQETKEVKNNLLKTSVRPTAVYKLETPFKENFKSENAIQPVLNKSCGTNIKTTDRTNKINLEPTKNINYNKLSSFAQSNLQDINYVNNNNMNTERYLQDPNNHEAYTNLQDINYINNNHMDPDRYLQNPNNHEAYTNLQDINYVNNNHMDPERYLQNPNNHEAYTNLQDINYVNNSHMDPERYLQDPNNHEAYTNLQDTNYVNNSHMDPERYLQDPNNHEAYTNLQDINYVNNNHMDPDRYLQNPNNHEAYTNLQDINYVNNNHMDPERYLQNPNNHEAYTNIGSHMQVTSIDDILDTQNIRTQNKINIDYTTPKLKNERITFIHDDIFLDKNIPQYSTSTNIGKQEQKFLEYDHIKELQRNIPLSHAQSNMSKIGENNISSRNYNQLQERTSRGGFEGKGVMPIINKVNDVITIESDKSKFNKKIEGFFDRYRH
jgi:hypothetical protein